MTTYLGVDWASKGWLCAAYTETDDGDAGAWEATMYPSMHAVWFDNRDAARILVDVPVGLPTDRRRRCDELASSRLGDRGASVFPTPCRDAVYTDTYEAAADVNEAATGSRLSSQTWGLLPRIREMDTLLRDHDEAAGQLREAHPEVCFDAFADRGATLPSKHDPDGVEARRRLLESVDSTLGGFYDETRRAVESTSPFARRIGLGNLDDLLDALVLAVTAKRGRDGLATLPGDPPRDERGLPMEIVYPAPGE